MVKIWIEKTRHNIKKWTSIKILILLEDIMKLFELIKLRYLI